MVQISNGLTGKDELTFLINTVAIDQKTPLEEIKRMMTIKLEGIESKSQAATIAGLPAVVKLYINGDQSYLLVLIKKSTQGFAVKISPQDTTKLPELGGILNSIKVIK